MGFFVSQIVLSIFFSQVDGLNILLAQKSLGKDALVQP